MGLSIHTNFASLTTQSQLNSTNKMLGTAMQRLGTGLRINSAADDAAGLQMATRLQAQSSGQKVGMRNAQDAVSMMQTAEGAMDEMSNIVQRMKDLATQSANGTSTADDRKAMDAEFVELRNELDNITNNTTFGGQNLLKTGFQGDVTFQIGGTADEKLELKSTGTLAKALAEVVGSGKGTDGAAVKLGIGAQDKATDSMAELDTFSQKIGEARSAFGANINRLEHTVNNLSNMKENTDMANGRIMDADFAQESTNMTKNQMLMQAGMSVLSNSNQMTGMVTSLLR
ncbi:lateral flagellin LafA [Aeromonas rivipollensis]|uniref:lateral flagellin LafA n=1 Tax=Aeromonas TaxID=642 RepID=UPI0004D57D25|nr:MULTISPECIES: lateral flagellin LafA [Aeromonas]KEP91269.1 Lateral flagellin [Aeromonas caviae]MDM5085954.1 lateral flagellin LafA [Aeromonas rivipollensis]MDM5098252.1 lateral flagellin LafA [Aeromonas rivipollensis]MDM5106618.1 lateral flagellin LafA [Aeromonas rivipollensis]MDX7647068.1 lateral flagellin LafA [Aeromonas caviae]